MATPASGILGQAAPGASDTTLYTVPKKMTVTGGIYVCNISAGALWYRIALREDGDSIANKHYIKYGLDLAANTGITIGPIELDETDVITVHAEDANIVYTFMGIEEPKDS